MAGDEHPAQAPRRHRTRLVAAVVFTGAIASVGAAHADRIYCYVPAPNVYEYTGVTVPSTGELISPDGSFTDGNSWNGAFSNIDPMSGVCYGKLPPGPTDLLLIGPVSDANGVLQNTMIGGGGGSYAAMIAGGTPIGSGVTFSVAMDGSKFSGGVSVDGGEATFDGGFSAGTIVAFGSQAAPGADYTLTGGQISAGTSILVGGAADTTVHLDASASFSAPVIDIDGAPTTDLEAQGNLTAPSYLTVGEYGSGTMTIGSDAVVKSGNGFVAGFTGSTGDVTVDGKWTTTGYLVVGQEGDGSMRVEDGGQVTTGDYLTVASGASGTLDIFSGGKVSTTAVSGLPTDLALVDGVYAGSNGVITVDGSGSQLTVKGAVNIGYLGTGALNVTGGGEVDVTGAIIRLGRFAGSSGTLTLSGSDSTFDFSGGTTFQVGTAGTGVLTVNQGFTLDTGSAAVTLGSATGSNGSATISDAGSSWTVSGPLTIGDSGTGTITVSKGGELDVAGGEIHLGKSQGGDGTLVLSGSSSSIDLTTVPTFIIGEAGTGTLTLNQGFQLNAGSADVTLGSAAGSTGTATVADSGTHWIVAGALTIGDSGTGSVTVSSGGGLAMEGAVDLGKSSGGNGTLTLSGNTSSAPFPSPSLTIGDAGTGTLNINQGFQFTSNSAEVTLGSAQGSTGTATIADSGTHWIVSGAMTIGDSGTGSVTVSGGSGLAVEDTVDIGKSSGGTGTLTLSGKTSSAPFQASSLTIGDSGTGTLNINQGFLFNTNTATVTLGSQSGGVGTVNVSGTGTQWNIPGTLTIGDSGTGTVNISAGAQVFLQQGDLYLGKSSGGTGTLVIDGATSLLDDSSTNLHIGDVGTGEIDIQNGASLDESTASLTLGLQSSGNGTIKVLSGGTFTADDLTLGGSGTGELDVGVDSGSVSLAAATVKGVTVLGANGGGSNLGTVNIGGGSTATFQGDVTVGGGGVGEMMLSPDGTATVQGDLNIARDSSATGTVTLDGASSLTVDGSLAIGQQGTAHLVVKGASTMEVDGDFSMAGLLADISVSGASTLALKSPDVASIGPYSGGTVYNITVEGSSQFTMVGGAAIGNSGVIDIKVTDAGSLMSMNTLVSQDQTATLEILNGAQVTVTGNCSCTALQWGAGNLTLQSGSTLSAPSAGISGGPLSASLDVSSGSVASFANSLTLWSRSTVDVTGGGVVAVGAAGPVAAGQVVIGAGGTMNSSVALLPPTINGTVIIQKGGVVSGSMVINGSVVNFGTHTIADDPTTVTVNGTYTLGPGGVIVDEVGPLSYSQLVVNGPVVLNGGTVQVTSFDGQPILPGQSYDFIQASGGITGQLGAIVGPNGFTTLNPTLSGNSLIFTAAHVPGSFSAVTTTTNERRLASMLDAASVAMSGGLTAVTDSLSQVPQNAVPAVLTAVSPEGLVSAQNASFQGQHGFDNTIVEATAAPGSPGATSLDASVSGDDRLWIQTYGAAGHYFTQPSVGSAGAETDSEGVAVGFDHHFDPNLLFGTAVGVSNDAFGVPARATSGDVTGTHLALFGAWSGDVAYASGLASYSLLNGRYRRFVSTLGDSGTLASHGVNGAWGGRIEVGGRFTSDTFEFAPYAAIEESDLSLSSFSETANGTSQPLAMTFPHHDAQSTLGLLGVRADTHFALGDIVVTPALDLAWGHEFSARRDLVAAFESSPTSTFIVDGATPGGDGAHVGLDLNAQLTQRLQAVVQFDLDQSSKSRTESALLGGLHYLW